MYEEGPLWYGSTAYCTDDCELISVPTRVIIRIELNIAIVTARAITD